MNTRRLIKSILANRFAWQRHLNGGTWHGLSIQTEQLLCSYGAIGFKVFSPYGESFKETITYDWELETITIE